MRVVAFLTGNAVVDRIIRHLELTFVAEKPPPASVFELPALMAAGANGSTNRGAWERGVARPYSNPSQDDPPNQPPLAVLGFRTSSS